MKKFNLLFWFLCVFVLAACSKKDISSENTAETTTAATAESVEAVDRNNATETKREHLGTKWGDDISSDVTEVDLKRLSNTPIAENAMRYADKDYKGRAVNSISLAAGKISFAVVDDQGNALPIYRTGDNYYLAGKDGQSYQLEYENHAGKTFEVVASVDGLDVLNGSAASRRRAGYVLGPNSKLKIEGFRKSESAVASFTFSKPRDAYAANTDSGSVKNTGIIGTVIYELQTEEQVEQPKTKYAPGPNAFPADKK